MQGEHCLRGDRGSWTERSAGGDPEPGGKAERPGTAQRLDGDPQEPDPGNAGEGRPPRRRFLFCLGCHPSSVGITTDSGTAGPTTGCRTTTVSRTDSLRALKLIAGTEGVPGERVPWSGGAHSGSAVSPARTAPLAAKPSHPMGGRWAIASGCGSPGSICTAPSRSPRAAASSPAAMGKASPSTLSMTAAPRAAMTAVTYQDRGGSRGAFEAAGVAGCSPGHRGS